MLVVAPIQMRRLDITSWNIGCRNIYLLLGKFVLFVSIEQSATDSGQAKGESSSKEFLLSLVINIKPILFRLGFVDLHTAVGLVPALDRSRSLRLLLILMLLLEMRLIGTRQVSWMRSSATAAWLRVHVLVMARLVWRVRITAFIAASIPLTLRALIRRMLISTIVAAVVAQILPECGGSTRRPVILTIVNSEPLHE